MKAIMVMFDTLNRRMLPPYGCDWIQAPNFRRLAERTAVFDNCYVGSMPCMPARRDLQTGRLNFLHRSWGPMEPFDDSMPELLKATGVYTHLVTDHQHYWEDGGASYPTRYSSFEFVRGQEGDPWKGHVAEPDHPETLGGHDKSHLVRQDWVNREYIKKEEDFPQAVTFELGLQFLRKNAEEDRWFLQLETFDPHEPFNAPEAYRKLYPTDYRGPHFDWPPYGPVTEPADAVEHCRMQYAALLSMCDAQLGKVLDTMDELGLWDDTMLIVNTDHGFLLGEHDHWAKCVQPFYNEVAHTPLFIWDPRSRAQGVRRQSLVQMIDLAPTLLDYFGCTVPQDMQGRPLGTVIAEDRPVRSSALFGIHGGHVNITDGRYVYMRGPAGAENAPLYNYTLMPAHMRGLFSNEELRTTELAEPFDFTKGLKTMRIGVKRKSGPHKLETMLFDLRNDPQQLRPIRDEVEEERLTAEMIRMMRELDAPKEQYSRLGLEAGQ